MFVLSSLVRLTKSFVRTFLPIHIICEDACCDYYYWDLQWLFPLTVTAQKILFLTFFFVQIHFAQNITLSAHQHGLSNRRAEGRDGDNFGRWKHRVWLVRIGLHFDSKTKTEFFNKSSKIPVFFEPKWSPRSSPHQEVEVALKQSTPSPLPQREALQSPPMDEVMKNSVKPGERAGRTTSSDPLSAAWRDIMVSVGVEGRTCWEKRRQFMKHKNNSESTS